MPEKEVVVQSEPEDPRLDRKVQFDVRSRNFPITAAISTKKPRGYRWRCLNVFDQGADGACVGFGIGCELASRPSEVQGLTNKFLKEQIYWEAQKIDPWDGGSYPGAKPFYEGTSVLSGVKIAQKLGYFKEYRWSFSIEDLKLGVGYAGPAVLGLNWYKGMMDTDANGFIHPTGRWMGGHCITATGISLKDDCFILQNSWGMGWGQNGSCKIKVADLDQLLDEDGEACFFLGRSALTRRPAGPVVPVVDNLGMARALMSGLGPLQSAMGDSHLPDRSRPLDYTKLDWISPPPDL